MLDYKVIYIDTEFSNFDFPQLISIGAVTDDGKNEFYGEVAPIPELCSGFVKKYVLCQLTGQKHPIENLSNIFLEWLNQMKSNILLCADSDYDLKLINGLYGTHPQLSNGFSCKWHIINQGTQNNPHHALKDARLLRLAHAPDCILDAG